MASTPEGRRLTEQHRLAQQQVRDDFLAEFIALWALLDTARLDDTGPGWVRAVLQLVQLFRQRSAQVATAYFWDFRAVELPAVTGGTAPRTSNFGSNRAGRPRGRRERDGRLTDPRPSSLVIPEPRQSRVRFDFDESAFTDRSRRETRIEFEVPDIDWRREDRATEVSLIVTGPVGQKSKIQRGKRPAQARDESLVEASGAGTRHVLTGGRQSLLTLLQDDAQALAWARVTDGDPCAFCAMLASRGPVYKTRQQAAFEAHDACACTVEPVYDRRAPWPGRAAEFRRLWREHIEGRYSGADARREWRRVYERLQREARHEQIA